MGAPDKPGRHGRWLLLLFATPILVVAIGVVISANGPAPPTVPVAAPPGYRVVADTYFGFAVPNGWAPNAAGTDSTGDSLYLGPTGWAGATIRARSGAPALGAQPPGALATFAEARSVTFVLTGGTPVSVPGADVAWSYTLERGGTAQARVVDAWVQASHTEIWLAAHGTTADVTAVIASLRA